MRATERMASVVSATRLAHSRLIRSVRPRSRVHTHRLDHDSHAATNQIHTDRGRCGRHPCTGSGCWQHTRHQPGLSAGLGICRQPCIQAPQVCPLWQGTLHDASMLASRLWASYLRPLWRETATMNHPPPKNPFNIEVRQRLEDCPSCHQRLPLVVT